MNQLLYLVKESIKGLKEHRMVLFPTFVTIFLCSVLLCFSLFVLRTGNSLLQMESSFYTIEAFLKDSISQTEIQRIEKELKSEKWLDSLEYIDKEKALNIFQKNFSKEMLDMVGENPLPASFRIYIAKRYWTPSILEEWINILENSGNFDAVRAPIAWAKTLSEWKGKIYFLPFLGILLLLFTLSLIISNAVRLSLFSRKILVENMKYTGASSFFIEFPFILEGFALGFLGSFTASLFAIASVKALTNYFPLLSNLVLGNLLPLSITVFSVSILSAVVSHRSVKRFLSEDRGADS